MGGLPLPHLREFGLVSRGRAAAGRGIGALAAMDHDLRFDESIGIVRPNASVRIPRARAGSVVREVAARGARGLGLDLGRKRRPAPAQMVILF